MRTLRDLREFAEGLPDDTPVTFRLSPDILADDMVDLDVFLELQGNPLGERRIAIIIKPSDDDPEDEGDE